MEGGVARSAWQKPPEALTLQEQGGGTPPAAQSIDFNLKDARMFIKFSVRNFRSFREEQTLDFVADKNEDGALADPDHETHTFDFQGARLLKVIALFGANASGKSNVLIAMKHFQHLLEDSKRMDASLMSWLPFKLDQEYAKMPTKFILQFFHGGQAYEYTLEYTVKGVVSERLSEISYNNKMNLFESKTEDMIFERNGRSHTVDELTETFITLGPKFKSKEDPKEAEIRINQFLRPAQIALAYLQFDRNSAYKQLINSLYYNLFFLSSNDDMGLLTDLLYNTYEITKEEKRAEFAQRILNMLKDADIDLKAVIFKQEELEPKINEAKEKMLPETNDDSNAISPQFWIESSDDFWRGVTKAVVKKTTDTESSLASFSFEKEESKGAQRLYNILGIIMNMLYEKRVLLFDEIDARLHPLLSRKIVGYFLDPETNPRNVQLVYTTQDSAHFDLNFLRRDQLWLCQKDAISGATELYSVRDYDFKEEALDDLYRNGPAYYLRGEFDGVPVLTDYFSHLEADKEENNGQEKQG